jgi:spermidine synthase
MKPVTTLATSRTPDGEPLTLQEHDGHYFMKVGGVQLMGTNASSSEKEMADLACANLPRGARVLIGGLGFGYTLRRVLELCPPDATVDVAELLQVVVDWNREFLTGVNGLLVDDPRVRIHIRDVADLISRAAENRYHAILLDVDNGPTSFVQRENARLYDRHGISQIQRSLRPGGRVAFWSAEREPAFQASLTRAGFTVEEIPAKAHERAKRAAHRIYLGVRLDG